MEDFFRDITKTNLENANVVLVGIPFDKNASLGKGASYAPLYLRSLSKNIPGVSKDAKVLDKVRLFDYGDIKEKGNESVIKYFVRVEKEVGPLFNKKHLSLFLGGDHSVNIPLFKAFLSFCKQEGKTPVLIHIDAHPDIMDEYLGNAYSHATPTRRALESGLEKDNLVFIGLRGFEVEEVHYFNENKDIKVYLASDVKKEGIKKISEEVISKYKSDKYALYISYDIDANDPSFAPGTGTPEAFGLSSDETLYLVNALISLKNTYALDMVEISPPLDTNDITSWLALKTIYEIFYTVGER